MPHPSTPTEADLALLAAALCGRGGALHPDERALVPAVPARPSPSQVAAVRQAIAAGGDPLGDRFCALRSPSTRRDRGATYTPAPIVAAMVGWARGRRVARVIDPGVGSARFLVAAGRAFPDAELIGVDVDPLATLLAKAHLAATGLARRARVELVDYRALELPPASGPTLFLGNPPYVRHHGIEPRWKDWLRDSARDRGTRASLLAGLHVHFFIRTAQLTRPGDLGCFITAAEWLDVNYGQTVRDLLVHDLGVQGVHVIEPTVEVFADAASTAVVACFEIGAPTTSVAMRRVASVAELGAWSSGRQVAGTDLAAARRWTPLTRAPRVRPEGYVELGELCRVHRGQVTGANDAWVVDPAGEDLPDEVLFPCVTRARELFASAPCLRDDRTLRRVIDLPEDLDELGAAGKRRVERFLSRLKARGVDQGYIARSRRRWWAVGLRAPAPILATYMARRPPAFVRNLAGARHINIAHGLYPRLPLSKAALDGLARVLSTTVALAEGRTYAGGLTKFEPREMERLLVPLPERLGEARFKVLK